MVLPTVITSLFSVKEKYSMRFISFGFFFFFYCVTLFLFLSFFLAMYQFNTVVFHFIVHQTKFRSCDISIFGFCDVILSQ